MLCKTLSPVNKTAAMVTQRASEANKFEAKVQPSLTWKTPIELIKLTTKEINNKELKDLIGVVSGRLTVIGFLGGSKWQVRCSCGNYSARKQKSILNDFKYDSCQECQQLSHLKRRDIWRRTGKDVHISEIP